MRCRRSKQMSKTLENGAAAPADKILVSADAYIDGGLTSSVSGSVSSASESGHRPGTRAGVILRQRRRRRRGAPSPPRR